jgi:hypothetical protein
LVASAAAVAAASEAAAAALVVAAGSRLIALRNRDGRTRSDYEAGPFCSVAGKDMCPGLQNHWPTDMRGSRERQDQLLISDCAGADPAVDGESG